MGRDLGILLAKASRGGISGVGEGLAAGGVCVLVQANEAVLGHVDLAANLHRLAEASVGHARETRLREGMRDVADGEDVGGDVFSGGAVAARRGAHELGVAVGEGNAQAVDLELAGVGDGMLRRGAEGLVRAGEPLVKLLEVHGVIDGVHALGVADGLELLGDVAADSLRVGVWGHELRMDLLDGLQLAEQAVELGIRDLRVIQGIVLVGIGAEQAVELRGADARALCRRGGSGASKERRLLGKVVCVLGHWSPIRLRQGMAGVFCLASSLARRG